MATNAAKELLKLIDSWKHELKNSNATVVTQRGGSSQFTEKLWRNQLDAAHHLLVIEEYIDANDERDMYAPLLADLRRMVFVPEQGWTQAPRKFDPNTRLALHQLGNLMTSSAARTLHLAPPQVDALQQAIDECLQILDALPISDDKGLQYLRELLARLKEALESGDVDLTVVRSQAYAAFGVAILHTESLPEQSRREFFQKLSRVVFPFASGTATGASGNLLGTVIEGILQIGQ